MIYENLPEFDRDFKKLSKRFRSLNDDFDTLKAVHIKAFHDPKIKALGLRMHDPVTIEGFCRENALSYKVRKFACKSLKNKGSNSGLRVIYVHHQRFDKITFVEIYFKADQEKEDRTRLRSFLASI